MYQFKQFQFDPQLETLTWDAQSRVLRPKVAQLLTLFLDNPDQLLTREQILTSLWQHSDFRDAALTQSIQELRKVLCDSAQQPQFIKTVPQKGYQWIAGVNNRQLALWPVVKRPLLWGALVVAVTGSVIWFADGTLVAPVVNGAAHKELQQAEKPRLYLQRIKNLTGKTELDWWGFALEQHMQQLASPSFELVNVASVTKEMRFEVTFNAQLMQQQQRYILNYQVIHKGLEPIQGQVISENLHTPVDQIAKQLIEQLSGKVQTLSTEPVSNSAPSRENYFLGLRALSYQGMRLAKPFFEAALAHDENNQAARLELANILWQMGLWQRALILFDKVQLSDEISYLNTRYSLYTGRYWLHRGNFKSAQLAFEQALKGAQALSHQQLIAQAYQLRADLAWLQLDWQAHAKAMHSAKLLMGAHSLSHSESQRSFYLANPPNAGPEQNLEIDMRDNLAIVQQAIHFYQRQEQQAQLMRSYFALGQNYLAALDTRRSALQKALGMAKEQGNILAQQQILYYLAFYHIQLHQGSVALEYLAELDVDTTEPHSMRWQSQFLTAMANMDIALQAPLINQVAFLTAKQGFEQILVAEGADELTKANAKLLLSWLLLSQQQYEKAMALAQQATDLFKTYKLVDSQGYGRYTQMYIQVAQKNYQQALEVLESQPKQILEALYGAFAYAQLGDFQHASAMLEMAQQRFAGKWRDQEQTLAQMIKAVDMQAQATHLKIEQLPPPYSVYCQSEWVLE
ncbi:hypothetical protein PA25_32350 [Pseudoalteromonas sp. A25]|uniref:winged helix-turn-helix domain-containing protein n=1 Tax=Pseudoalteromonas sp. A25 TaxID=116092 RepID=UPI00129FBFED|nr:winged helix-turn-helix domain-containing protein [Pseudoalteromonas sp. A25]BBN83250.1 hypothetical protein PA25_32350 [Pseudoalteromonas sp. A25]